MKILNAAETSPDGIPLGLIAQYQIGNVYWETNRKTKAIEAFFKLYESLLESRWVLSKNQFYFYCKKIKARLETSLADTDEPEAKKSFMEKWEKFNRLEEEKLKRMQARENLVAKVIPLLKAKTSSSITPSGNFYHLAETISNKTYLVSWTAINNKTVLGMRMDSEVLSKKLLPEILERLPLKKDWHVQIKDEFGNTVAGKDMTSLQESLPQLTFSQGFEENFPPWEVNVYQGELRVAEGQFNLRRNIYILSVLVVIVAILFGGFLAIRSTAKELELAKLKSEFVSTISHDFRTPLTSIRYLAELLMRERVKQDVKKQEYYETIIDESERLNRLVENILDFSKIEAEMKEYRFEKTDISRLTRDVAAQFQRQITGKKFRLETEIPKQMPSVLADKEAISRALFNVLDNALKYRGQSQKAYLRAWSDEQSVFLEVKDEGIGISREEQKKVFEKFYRIDEAHRINIKGSGIGLTVVTHIIKAHGGKVKLDSEKEKGTKVTLELPLKREK
jgi:signal transduction histidine kinase